MAELPDTETHALHKDLITKHVAGSVSLTDDEKRTLATLAARSLTGHDRLIRISRIDGKHRVGDVIHFDHPTSTTSDVKGVLAGTNGGIRWKGDDKALYSIINPKRGLDIRYQDLGHMLHGPSDERETIVSGHYRVVRAGKSIEPGTQKSYGHRVPHYHLEEMPMNALVDPARLGRLVTPGEWHHGFSTSAGGFRMNASNLLGGDFSPWHVEFEPSDNRGNDRFLLTGKAGHKAVEVMRAVYDGLHEFIRDVKPHRVQIDADADEPSRVKAYAAMMPVVARRLGYDHTVTPGEEFHSHLLTRPRPWKLGRAEALAAATRHAQTLANAGHTRLAKATAHDGHYGWLTPTGTFHENGGGMFGHTETAETHGFGVVKHAQTEAYDAGWVHVAPNGGSLSVYHPRGEYTPMQLHTARQLGKDGMYDSLEKHEMQEGKLKIRPLRLARASFDGWLSPGGVLTPLGSLSHYEEDEPGRLAAEKAPTGGMVANNQQTSGGQFLPRTFQRVRSVCQRFRGGVSPSPWKKALVAAATQWGESMKGKLGRVRESGEYEQGDQHIDHVRPFVRGTEQDPFNHALFADYLEDHDLHHDEGTLLRMREAAGVATPLAYHVHKDSGKVVATATSAIRDNRHWLPETAIQVETHTGSGGDHTVVHKQWSHSPGSGDYMVHHTNSGGIARGEDNQWTGYMTRNPHGVNRMHIYSNPEQQATALAAATRHAQTLADAGHTRLARKDAAFKGGTDLANLLVHVKANPTDMYARYLLSDTLEEERPDLIHHPETLTHLRNPDAPVYIGGHKGRVWATPRAPLSIGGLVRRMPEGETEESLKRMFNVHTIHGPRGTAVVQQGTRAPGSDIPGFFHVHLFTGAVPYIATRIHAPRTKLTPGERAELSTPSPFRTRTAALAAASKAVHAPPPTPERLAKKKTPVFYSQAEKILQDKVPNKGSAHQVLQTLLSAGVKPDELKWNGLDELLGEAHRTGTPVEKAALLEHAAKHRVELKEKVLGKQAPDPVKVAKAKKGVDEAKDAFTKAEAHHSGSTVALDKAQRDQKLANPLDPSEDERLALDYAKGLPSHSRSHYAKWQYGRGGQSTWRTSGKWTNSILNPGVRIEGDHLIAENSTGKEVHRIPKVEAKRELLTEQLRRLDSKRQNNGIHENGVIDPKQLADHDEHTSKVKAAIASLDTPDPAASQAATDHLKEATVAHDASKVALENAERAHKKAVSTHRRAEAGVGKEAPFVTHPTLQLVMPGQTNHRLMAMTLPEDRYMAPPDGTPQYREGWKHGFDGKIHNPPSDEKDREEYDTGHNAGNREARSSVYREGHEGIPTNTVAHVRYGDLDTPEGKMLHLDELQSDWHQDADSPRAPFRKTWHEVALKRMLRHAAENGYAGMTLTPGQMQNDRYKLETHIQDITHNKNEDGTYNFVARPFGGKSILKTNLTEEQLHKHLGKELGRKVIERQGEQKTYHDHGNGTYTALDARGHPLPSLHHNMENARQEGLQHQADNAATHPPQYVIQGWDLKMGGQGMRDYYDKHYPAALDKIAKKWGVKMTTKTINGQTLHHIPITDEMKKSLPTEPFAQFSRRVQTVKVSGSDGFSRDPAAY